MSESTTAFPQVSSVLGSDDCLVNAGRKPVWVGMDTDPLTQRLEQFHAGAWVHIAFVVVE